MGMTDADGKMPFKVKLPATLAGIPLQDGNALVTLRATVTDTADQEVTKELPLTVAAQAVRLSLVPEATLLVPGVENRLHLFATDPLGAPVGDAEVSIGAGAAAMSDKTDAFGHAEAQWTPTDADATVAVALATAEGDEGRADVFVRRAAGRRARARAHRQIRVRDRRDGPGAGVRVQRRDARVRRLAQRRPGRRDAHARRRQERHRELQHGARRELDRREPRSRRTSSTKTATPCAPVARSSSTAKAHCASSSGRQGRVSPGPSSQAHAVGDRRAGQAGGGSARRADRGRGGVRVDRRAARVCCARSSSSRTPFATPQYEIAGPIVNFEQLLVRRRARHQQQAREPRRSRPRPKPAWPRCTAAA